MLFFGCAGSTGSLGFQLSRAASCPLQAAGTPIVDKAVENEVESSGEVRSECRPFESFVIGETHRSTVRELPLETILAFAELTGDRNPVHTDPEFARRTHHRGLVAHGLLLNALLAGMAYEYGIMGRNILALEHSDADYLGPVRPGDRIYGTTRILSLDPDAGRRCGRVHWEVRMYRIRRDGSEQLVVRAHWRTLVFKQAFLPAWSGRSKSAAGPPEAPRAD